MNLNTLVSENQLRQAHNTIKGIKLPVIPDIVIKVNNEINSRHADPQKIAKLIESDIALAGNVLKLANSPLYRRNAEIQSVKHAAMLLGLENVKNLVITSAFKQAVANDNAINQELIDDSLIIAQCASGIASMVDNVSSNDTYLCGLFHDAGQLLLMQKFEDYADFMCHWKNEPIGIIEAENEQFGTNHTDVGFLLAKYWELPESVCYGISQHHTTSCSDIDDSNLRGNIAVLKIANYLHEGSIGSHTDDNTSRTWSDYRDSALNELTLELDTVKGMCTL